MLKVISKKFPDLKTGNLNNGNKRRYNGVCSPEQGTNTFVPWNSLNLWYLQRRPKIGKVTGLSWFDINNKDVMVIPDDYRGSPAIYYEPDIILISEATYNKYKHCFKIPFKHTKLLFI